MRKSRFSESQIIRILKNTEAGLSISDLCRVNGISSTTYYKWMTKFGGMEASDVRRLAGDRRPHGGSRASTLDTFGGKVRTTLPDTKKGQELVLALFI